ncbi:protein required for normal CLN1 and CLN2 G1 cyclin expression [Rhizophlyctis rosea]|nr:protein required for normal CLN1 and CLN2 G1 cyclin expression [Rhizophlyctis rosea]
MPAGAGKLEIPLGRDGEDVLEVDLDELENSEGDILQILVQEQCKLSVFLKCAFEFSAKGLYRAFEQILESGLAATEGHSAQSEASHRQLLMNTLASYWIETAKTLPEGQTFVYEGDKHFPPRSKEFLLEAATRLLNQAESINAHNIFVWLGRGNLYLARKDYQKAEYQFNSALRLDQNDVSAHIGLAAIAFNKKDWKSSLEHYQRVLRLEPYQQPDVRVPIALCFHRLQRHAQARKALIRALEVDPSNVEALSLLSTLDWNILQMQDAGMGEQKELDEELLQRAVLAHQTDDTNPLANNLLAFSFLRNGDYDKAIVLADRALKYGHTGLVRADSLFCKSCALQAQGKYQEAYNCIKESTTLNPRSVASQYVYGQLSHFNGETDQAIQCFENLLQHRVDHPDTLKRLAYIYSGVEERRPKAKEMYERIKTQARKRQRPDEDTVKREDKRIKVEGKNGAAGVKQEEKKEKKESKIADEEFIDDTELLIDMGRICEETDPNAALLAYRTAMSKLEKSGERIPVELLNNLAVLHHLRGELVLEIKKVKKEQTNGSHTENGEDPRPPPPAARDYYDDALRALAELGEDGRKDALQTTLLYNLGLMHEGIGHLAKAEEYHEKVLDLHPGYIESRLRLAVIMFQTSRGEEGDALLSEIIEVDKRNIEARLLKANWVAQKDLREARNIWESVLQTIERNNPYALASMGNYYLTARRVLPKDQGPKREDYKKRAWDFFEKSLRISNTNIYAAMGLGTLLADTDQWDQASKVFTHVQELAVHVPAAAVNLAHTLVLRQQPKQAITLYKKVLQRGFNDVDANVSRSLARAYYIMAKTEKKPAHMKDALRYIQKAIRAKPGDLSLYFNMALVKQQTAALWNERAHNERDVAAMKQTMKGVEVAEKIFNGLAGFEKGVGYDKGQARERAKYCHDVKRNSEKKMHETEVLKRSEAERIRDMEEAAIREKQEREERERREQEEKDRRQAELKAKREETLQKLKTVDEQRKTKEEEEERNEDVKREKKEKKERAKGERRDDDMDVDGEGSSKPKKKRRTRKRSTPRDDDDDERGRSASEALSGGRDDSDDEGNGGGRGRKGRGRKVLSAAIISDSDEDVEAEPSRSASPPAERDDPMEEDE